MLNVNTISISKIFGLMNNYDTNIRNGKTPP